jgi:hypothetical protein
VSRLQRTIEGTTRSAFARIGRTRDERDGRSFLPALDQVQAYCQFVGWPRSGHSVLGHVLNAHPDTLVAHEADALRFVGDGWSWPALVGKLHRFDIDLGRRDRVSAKNDYGVPGQWQGRQRTVRLIGDKRGGSSAEHLAHSIDPLVRLERIAPVPVHLVVVTRHPLDNIARMSTKDFMSPLEAAARYDRMAEGTQAGIEQVGDRAWTGSHEDFVADPKATLVSLCDHFGLDPDAGWLDAGASIIFESVRQARDDVEWTPALLGLVDEIIDRYPFLHRYREV